jgi:hypothetical protein
MDETKDYRVTIICKCQLEAAWGIGETPEEARKGAEKHYRRDLCRKGKHGVFLDHWNGQYWESVDESALTA